MGHDDIYLWYNRILKEKDVDKYINKIGAWHENISSKKLVILILSVLCLLGVGIFCEMPNKQKNSLKTAVYNTVQNKMR